MKVLFVSSGSPEGKISPIVNNQGISILNEGIELSFLAIVGKGVIGYLRNIRSLRKMAKSYDVIHAHYGLTGLLVGLSFVDKPIVLSIMGTDACGDFDKNGNRILKSYIIMLMTQMATLFANDIIVKSPNLKKWINFKKKVHLIPNGIDFELFRPMNYLEARERIKLGVNEKVILYLADTKKSNKNFSLIKESIQFVKTANVKLLNPFPISQPEFVEYLNACDLFVLTSYNEGSPNVIKEAMACNCPIVSTDVGDVKSIINKTRGCFISSYSPNDFANKIDMALKFNDKTTGRKDIDYLKSDLVAKKIIKIYRRLV